MSTAEWRRRPLRAIAEVQLGRARSPDRAEGPNMIRYLRAANVKDGHLDLSEIKEMDFTPREQSEYGLRPGDVLVTEGAGSLAAVGANAVWNGELHGTICYQNHVLRLRAKGDTEPRFLGWWARHAHASSLFASIASGAQIYNLGADPVRRLPVSIPPVGVQRLIADFLDREIAQMDRIAALRRSQEALLDERELAAISLNLAPKAATTIQLKHLATIQSGLTVDGSRNPGTDPVTRPYLRVANVHADTLALDSVTEVTVPRSLADRCSLRYGDVLMTEGGDLDKLGRGTIWRDELPGALHQNHVFAVRAAPRRLDPEFLALITRTSHARAYFERTGSKTTGIASTSSDKIMNLPIPRLTVEAQRALVLRVTDSLRELSAVRSAVRRQRQLLQERRQALITAAVNGQLEIPGVAA